MINHSKSRTNKRKELRPRSDIFRQDTKFICVYEINGKDLAIGRTNKSGARLRDLAYFNSYTYTILVSAYTSILNPSDEALKIRGNTKRLFYVEGLSCLPIYSFIEGQEILLRGIARRVIIQFSLIDIVNKKVGRWIIDDLAGLENQKEFEKQQTKEDCPPIDAEILQEQIRISLDLTALIACVDLMLAGESKANELDLFGLDNNLIKLMRPHRYLSCGSVLATSWP